MVAAMALRRAGLALLATMFAAVALVAAAAAASAGPSGDRLPRVTIGADQSGDADLDEAWQGDDDPRDPVTPSAPHV
jgi:hypothetical protein